MGGVFILLAAAGASRRMRGADKLLEKVEGEPILRRAAQAALRTGQPVLVTLPKGNAERAAALDGLALEAKEIDASEGMAASLRTGVAAAREAGANGVLVMLADMPEIETNALRRLIAAFEGAPDKITRAATDSGQPGNPVILPARLFTALYSVTGDTGARAVVQSETPILCPLPGKAAITDLDTPEDWAAWRAKTGR